MGSFYFINSTDIIHYFIVAIAGSIIFWINNIYNALLRFIDQKQFFNLFFSTFFVSCLLVVFFDYALPKLFGINIFFPRSIPFIFFGTLLISLTCFRFISQYILNFDNSHYINKTNVLIYGANESGYNLYNSISKNQSLNILGFIDNDNSLKKTFVTNKKVLGNIDHAIKLKKKYENLTIYLNDPSISQKDKINIYLKLSKFNINLRMIPSIPEFSNNEQKNVLFNDLPIHLLIGRKEKKLNPKLSKLCIENQNVLITGAGGSIGSELSKQVLDLNPNNLILLENSEYNMFSSQKKINQILERKNLNTKVFYILGSINDSGLLNKIFSDFKINTIFHAAAYKHVDLVENNIVSAINNNIFGTLKLAKYARTFKIKSFILISTDKAVNPSSIMGKTKKISEIIIQSIANTLKGKKYFSIVRFGNVFESSGSVIQIFKEQISNNGPITITDKEVTRYFMTIKEAAQLVIEASSLQLNGEVYILDMGKPIKILDLAEKLIKFYGFNVKNNSNNLKNNNDIEIKFIGLKKGEKLHEKLSTNKKLQNSSRSKIFISKEKVLKWEKLEYNLNKLEYLIKKNNLPKIIQKIDFIINETNEKK